MSREEREFRSDEIPSIKCCVCNEKGLTRDAKKYCVECCKYYCSTCLDVHLKNSPLNFHQFLDNSSFGPFSTERCYIHPGKIVDLYCHDHDEVACATCIAVSHRGCILVESIPENIDELYRKEEIKLAKEKLNKSKTRMEEFKRIIEREIKELKESLDEAVESIKSFRQEISKILDSLEQKTIEKAQREYNTILQEFNKNLKEARLVLDSIAEVTPKLTESVGNKAQEFVCWKISAKTISNADGFKTQQNTDERVKFTRDNNIVCLLKLLATLGEETKISEDSLQLETKTTLYSVRKKKEVDVKITQDKRDCYIHGCCITDDGCLLLADYYNSKVKRLNVSTEKIKDWLDLEGGPLAVCLVSRTEAAVTLSNNSLQFFSLGDKLKSTKTLKMDHDCSGLAFANNKLIISDSKKNVYMYNISGQQMQLISPKGIFSKTRHIAVSNTSDRVCVADYNNGLVVLDYVGKYLSTLSDPTVSVCHGVCTVGRNILVCGYSSNNIVQIGHNLKVLGEIAKVTGPLSLCFDSQRNRIIVSTEDKIIILEIQ